jgi:hypothetical protein
MEIQRSWKGASKPMKTVAMADREGEKRRIMIT